MSSRGLASHTVKRYNASMTLIGSRFAAVRKRLGMSQGKFVKAIGVGLSTLHDWEQGRAEPSGAALALLRVLEANPEAVLKALDAKPDPAKARKGRKP
jgi:DNA-binding transcriptional regulator YiaG